MDVFLDNVFTVSWQVEDLTEIRPTYNRIIDVHRTNLNSNLQRRRTGTDARMYAVIVDKWDTGSVTSLCFILHNHITTLTVCLLARRGDHLRQKCI